ncbi:AAEL011734-PA, partial [Aedes aegypti]
DIEGNFLDLSHNSSARIINEIKPFLGHHNQKVRSICLPVLHNLRVLDLRHCGFSSLPNNAFANTPNLVKLFLAHNSLASLNALNFNGLSNLRHLDLSYISQDLLTGLIGYEQQVDPYNSLTEGLDLSEDVFAPLTNLSFLDVSYTKLLSYSARAFRSVAVIQLSLCYTGIPIIVGSMMNGSLKVLDISGNPGITTAIHHDASEARGFNANLEILVCENSTVKHLDWLNGMISLKVLLLGYNNINQLTNVTFANMESLEILDLSNNHVSNWHQRVFVSNENLFILDLSANNINVLTTEMLYDMATVEFLAIGQNSFVCHCLLREFIELAAKNSQAISCLLNSIEMHKSEGDYNVLFRVIHSYVSTMYNSTAKFQESLDKYSRGRSSTRVYRKMVNSRMTSRFFRVDCNNDTDVEEDDTDIPDDYVDHPLYDLNIQIIDFDEENYKCIDLDNSEFYLFEQERCTFDRTLLDNLNLGVAANTTTANIVKFTLMFFGFALVAFIIYISKWEYIKYFCIIVRNATVLSLLKHKNETLLRKQSLASVAGCYMYDVFVSYSEQDRQWVLDELLPNLERTEDIAVCLHERDFQVGVSILENIIYCMDQSRTLLLVMSESFLLSHWCQFEMHLAQHRLLETRREQLILVLLEDIPKVKRSKTLQYLMKTKTYIIWPQQSTVAESEQDTEVKEKSKKEQSKKKARSRKQNKEKDPQSLVEERKLFWKRLRNAISESAVWENDGNGETGGEKRRHDSSSSKESTA